MAHSLFVSGKATTSRMSFHDLWYNSNSYALKIKCNKKHLKQAFWKWLMNILQLYTITSKKFSTIVLGRKNVPWAFIRWKHKYHKITATFFKTKTIIESFLHLMVLICKVLINHLLLNSILAPVKILYPQRARFY